MIHYTSENNNFDIRVNGVLQNQVYFKLESVDTVSTDEDEHGIKSFTIFLINRTIIQFERTNIDESVKLITEIFNSLIDILISRDRR